MAMHSALLLYSHAEDEHIAGCPGARGDRMVLNMGRVIELVLPDHVPVPVELLDVAAVPAADVYLVAPSAGVHRSAMFAS